MKLTRNEARKKRKFRIRKRLSGSPEKPRLVVFRSNKHIYAQVVDDTSGTTKAASSSLGLAEPKPLNLDTAKEVGLLVAKQAQEKSIDHVVFDRNGYKYHGRIKALADGAREGGLKF